MIYGRNFWFSFGERVRLGTCLSWWKPWDELKLSRSISVTRLYNIEVPFITIDIALFCVEIELMLYII